MAGIFPIDGVTSEENIEENVDLTQMPSYEILKQANPPLE